eukprot:scaffold99834_cov36-Phaeocystis_antarctica.AAC.1
MATRHVPGSRKLPKKATSLLSWPARWSGTSVVRVRVRVRSVRVRTTPAALAIEPSEAGAGGGGAGSRKVSSKVA